jgi:hypothetical protein
MGRGEELVGTLTQGVALSWTISGPSGRGAGGTNVEVAHPPFCFVLHSCVDESVSACLSLPIHLC